MSETTGEGAWADGGPAGAAVEAKPLVRNPFESAYLLRPRFLLALAGALAVLAFAEPGPVSFAAGLPLVAAGEALRIWGAGHLWKSRELVVSGPYARLRHPLYLGTLAASLGFLVIAGPRTAAIGIPLFLLFFFGYYYPYKERGEGERLERRFGESFRAYRAAVPALRPALRSRLPAALERPEARWRLSRVRDNDELGTAVAVAAALLLLGARGLLPF